MVADHLAEEELEMRGEITMSSMTKLLASGWRTIAGSVVICVLGALVYLAGARPVYTSTMVVAPMPEEASSSPGPAALSGMLGALTGGTQTDDLFKRYQALYSSVVLAGRLQQRYHTLQTIYHGNWDAASQKWVEHPTWRKLISGPLNLLAGVPAWIPPNVVDLASYLEDSVLVHSTLRNDFVRITYTSPDPNYASTLLLQIHQTADDLLRDQAAERARAKVAYLEAKLATTNVADYRQTLLGLLAEQQKIQLLTQPGATYAAELVDGPTTDPHPSAPKPTMTVLIAILLGAVIGASIVLTWGPIATPAWASLDRNRIARLKAFSQTPLRWKL